MPICAKCETGFDGDHYPTCSAPAPPAPPETIDLKAGKWQNPVKGGPLTGKCLQIAELLSLLDIFLVAGFGLYSLLKGAYLIGALCLFLGVPFAVAVYAAFGLAIHYRNTL
ncbi:MAG: hypothetical protein ACON38_04125 [Akkermansiaceae bacterium]